jgi:hypothetical protein
MGTRLLHALQEGILLGVKWGVALILIAGIIIAIVGDYGLTRQATAWLMQPTGITDPKGQVLTREDLIDRCIRDLIQRQAAAGAPTGAVPAPAPPPAAHK